MHSYVIPCLVILENRLIFDSIRGFAQPIIGRRHASREHPLQPRLLLTAALVLRYPTECRGQDVYSLLGRDTRSYDCDNSPEQRLSGPSTLDLRHRVLSTVP